MPSSLPPHSPQPRSLPISSLALATTLALASPAMAQEAPFDPDSYGQAQLVVRQNVGDAACFIAASEGGAFEPIAELAPSDRWRRWRAPTGESTCSCATPRPASRARAPAPARSWATGWCSRTTTACPRTARSRSSQPRS